MQQVIRELDVGDVDRLVAIDAKHTGGSRRRFFEKRLAAAKHRPADFIPIGVARDGALCGFAVVRLLHGEFGQVRDVAVLDAIGVEPDSRETGIGQTLLQELAQRLQRRGVNSIQTEAEWTNHAMLRFFQGSGFTLAPRIVLERPTALAIDESGEDV